MTPTDSADTAMDHTTGGKILVASGAVGMITFAFGLLFFITENSLMIQIVEETPKEVFAIVFIALFLLSPIAYISGAEILEGDRSG